MNLINLADHRKLAPTRFNKRKWTTLLLFSLLFAGTILLSGLSAVANSHLANPEGFTSADAPNSDSIRRWFNPKYETDTRPLESFAKVEIPQKCDPWTVYPAHPQQTTKQYHVFRNAVYDVTKLSGDSESCQVPAPRNKQRCLQSKTLCYAVISDIFTDSCGNYYRGFWKISFFSNEESMGTLSSKGRTLYTPPQPISPNDQYVGGTYAVSRDELMFLTPSFAEDNEGLAQAMKNSKKTHIYDAETHLFKYVGPYQ